MRLIQVSCLIAILWGSALPLVAQERGSLEEAKLYADTFGVDLTEAQERLEMQRLVGPLAEWLEDEELGSFAGLYIEHVPEFKVVVQFTDVLSGHQRLSASSRIGSLVRKIEVREVALSLAALEATFAEVSAATRRHEIEGDLEIDIKNNRVILRVVDAERAERAFSAARVDEFKHFEILEVEELARPSGNLIGGIAGSTCTMGFTVRAGDERQGILTAGHCGDLQAAAGVILNFENQCFRDNCDLQWHSAPGCTFLPQFVAGFGIRDVLCTYSRSEQTVGEFVCKQGSTTGLTCGEIVSKSFRPSYIARADPTFIRVNSTNGLPVSLPGDSGGPYFRGNAAYGITSCQVGKIDSCYTAINYIHQMDELTVLLATASQSGDPSCMQECRDEYNDCRVDACYWAPDDFMCNVGCALERRDCECDCGDALACC